MTDLGHAHVFPKRQVYRETKVPQVTWMLCPRGVCNDELGCHYDYEGNDWPLAQDGIITGRRCVVNRQGFSDTDDFAVGEDFRGRMRIMTLGDSFTHGFSADAGKSFVETIETLLPEVVLWNMAINATGTNQAVATLSSNCASAETTTIDSWLCHE